LDNNPILLCSHAHRSSACLELLYKSGYRISLAERDEKRITAILSLNLTKVTDLQLDYILSREELGLWNKICFLLNKKQTIDPVCQFLRFQAHANPCYTQVAFTQTYAEQNEDLTKMNHLDPIRRCFALSMYAHLLASGIPEHCAGFQEISESCDEFTKDLLEHCNSKEEVKILLDHCPSDANDERTNWHLALWDEQKRFVSHSYYQHFQWEKMTQNINWDSKYFLMQVKMYLSSIFLFICYPLIVLFDSIARNSDIIFISPTKLQSIKKEIKSKSPEDEKDLEMNVTNLENTKNAGNEENAENEDEQFCESYLFGFFRQCMQRPIYRMFISGSLDIIFLICLFLKIYNIQEGMSKEDKAYYPTIITLFFVANYLVEDIVNIYRLNWLFFHSLWSVYSLVTNLLLGLGSILGWLGYAELTENERANLANLGGNRQINVGLTLLSIGASMSFLRISRWLILHRKIGPILICIVKVVKDVLHVFIVFAIIYIAFSVGLWSMFKQFQNSGTVESTYWINETKLTTNEGFKGIMSLLFWRVFDGDFSDAEVYHIVGNQTEVDLKFSHLMGVTFFAVYQGITVIIMMNILIAMMNSTYSKVWENADKEWKYSKTFYKVQFLRPRETLPPPFRWVYYFAFFMRKLKHCKVQQNDKTSDEKKKYVELMNKLIKRNMQEELVTGKTFQSQTTNTAVD